MTAAATEADAPLTTILATAVGTTKKTTSDAVAPWTASTATEASPLMTAAEAVTPSTITVEAPTVTAEMDDPLTATEEVLPASTITAEMCPTLTTAAEVVPPLTPSTAAEGVAQTPAPTPIFCAKKIS